MKKTNNLVLLAMFTAIIFILAFTPFGFIQLWIIKATIIHIPVIIGSLLLGPAAGGILGFFFGAASFISNTTAPTLLSFAFSPLIPLPGELQGSLPALAVCFIPRILVGIVPWYLYRFLQPIIKKRSVVLIITGLLGSMVNTVMVMNLIYLLFSGSYASVQNIPQDGVYKAILAVIFMNGIPEAVAAGILTCGVSNVLMNLFGRNENVYISKIRDNHSKNI